MSSPNDTKLCPKCQQWKPATSEYFNVNNRAKDKLAGHCKVCKQEYRARAHQKIYEQKKRWRENNPEREKARVDKWCQENRDALLENKRRYHAENKNELKARYLVRLASDPAKYRSKRKFMGDRKRVKGVENAGEYQPSDLITLFDEQNGRCFYCGITLSWSIDGDVHHDHMIPLSKGGSNTIDNIVICCLSCNASKKNKTPEHWQRVRGW